MLYVGELLPTKIKKKSKNLSKLKKPLQKKALFTKPMLGTFVSIIQLPPKEGARYGFDVPSRYQKAKTKIKTNVISLICRFKVNQSGFT